MTLKIVGVGTSTPAHVIRPEDAAEMMQRLCCQTAKQARVASHLVGRTGVSQRQTCVPHVRAYDWQGELGGPTLGERMELYEQHAAPLALESARAAISDAGLNERDITHLVTVSCTGFESPGVDFQLIDGLGLPTDTQRVHVGYMGCHAAINGLRVAQGLAACDKQAAILLVATELCSIHYAYGWKPDQLVGNAIFGDGSAAMVGIADESEVGRSDLCQWRLARTGSQILPESDHLMAWRVRDHGFEMTLSSALPTLIEQQLASYVEQWLRELGFSIDDIGSWAIHPGGPRVLTAVENALSLEPSATQFSRQVLEAHGNMSSPTLLFILQRLREAKAQSPCVAIGFGPGIVAEMAIFV